MNIWLIRHTKLSGASDVCYGRLDVPLAETFVADADAVKQKLPPTSDSHIIITSPASRCYKLASTLSSNPVIDDDLSELDFGSWEGKRWDDIPRTELDNWANNLATTPPPQGESLADLQMRVQRAWQRLSTLNTTEVFCISHAGFIRILLAYLFEIPISRAFSLSLDYGGCSLIEVSDLPPTLRKFNI